MIYTNNIKILFLPLFIFSSLVNADFRSWFLMVPAAVVTVSLSTVKWFLNTDLRNDLLQAKRSHDQTMATNAESLRLGQKLERKQKKSLVIQQQLLTDATRLRDQAAATAASLPKLRQNLDECESASVSQRVTTADLLAQLASLTSAFREVRAVSEEVQSGIKNLSVQMVAQEKAEADRQVAIDAKIAEFKRIDTQNQARFAAAIAKSEEHKTQLVGLTDELARQNAEREKIALIVQDAIKAKKLLAPVGDGLIARLVRSDKQ